MISEKKVELPFWQPAILRDEETNQLGSGQNTIQQLDPRFRTGSFILYSFYYVHPHSHHAGLFLGELFVQLLGNISREKNAFFRALPNFF